jgi:hypothetical protein
MNKILFIVLFSLSLTCHAQKSIEKIIENSAIKTIVVIDDSMFKIKISTNLNDNIVLQSKIEGEYANAIIVSAVTKNDTLYISSAFQPFFKTKNDKLSAHKVVSVELVLVLPENLTVYAKSAIASAEIKGKYKKLSLEFAQGNTTVKDFIGDAMINSVNGNIKIESNFAVVAVTSKTGSIEQEPLVSGMHHIKLNTINGNISVTKTKN